MPQPARDQAALWMDVSAFVADVMGLDFPRERLADLQRGVSAAADEFGFDDPLECAGWLLSARLARPQLEVLASHLTIPETYFMRDRRMFEVLASEILVPLLHERRGRDQRLRLWSAGCCSGEEAYSLAILLHQLVPDLARWQVSILATDVNARALRTAEAGIYGEWSFRDVPAEIKDGYFTRTRDGRYEIRGSIKALVSLEYLNLVDDVYPSLATGTNAMDVIVCRNVLMYFTKPQTRRVVDRLHRALRDGGRLIVSPSEASQSLFPQFVARNFPGLILFQKSAGDVRVATLAPLPVEPEVETDAALPPWAPSSTLDTIPGCDDLPAPVSYAGTARALANEGRLTEARSACDRWLAAEKLNAAGHYLRALVVVEQGDFDEARRGLERALYLDPGFVLAHFTLGTLARRRRAHAEGDRHFANALQLLRRLPAHDVLPESDGLTVDRLIDTIEAASAVEVRL